MLIHLNLRVRGGCEGVVVVFELGIYKCMYHENLVECAGNVNC